MEKKQYTAPRILIHHLLAGELLQMIHTSSELETGHAKGQDFMDISSEFETGRGKSKEIFTDMTDDDDTDDKENTVGLSSVWDN